jgi:hypothetical protein
MELGQYQLQIFVSLVVILGAAFAALICDFLKGNNEQLRELVIELKGRREEEGRRGQSMAAHMSSAPTASTVSETSPAAVAKGAPRRAASPEALAAMERGAQLAGTPRKTAAASGFSTAIARSRPVQPATCPVARIEAAAASMTIQNFTPAAAPAKRAKRDWVALLAQRHSASAASSVASAPAVSANRLVNIPAGFHDGYVLSNLIQKHQPVTGLVVSIGVTANGKNDTIPEPVVNLVRSLMGPQDFACPSANHEFLLIYPRLSGAAAQRQLSVIAQRLWSFQLRSLGSTSILFSWGGVEVASESIDEAIASASERMNQTRRGRKLISMPLRQAV